MTTIRVKRVYCFAVVTKKLQEEFKHLKSSDQKESHRGKKKRKNVSRIKMTRWHRRHRLALVGVAKI